MDNQFKCSGDCLNCRSMQDRKIQWQYCAAQFTYNSMRMIEAMQGKIEAMSGTITELAAKVEAIQNSEAMVFDPQSHTEIAQSGDGAESRSPETNQIQVL